MLAYMMQIPLSKPEILDSLSTAILATDMDLKICYMNQAAEEMLGKSFHRIANRPITSLISSPQLELHIVQTLRTRQSHVNRGGKLSLPGKEQTINVDCVISTIIEKEEVRAVLFEITQVDRQLRIARETRLINTQTTNQTVLRGIAHEIKNPLGGLRGAAQLLEIEFAELADNAVKEYTSIIISEADRLTKLVDTMLGSNQPPHKVPVNIHEVLEHARQISEATLPDTISLHTDYDPSIPEITGDRDQLVQVVLNIINNAINSLENEGRIILRTRVLRNFTIRQDNYPLVLMAQIIDNGRGIPRELQDSIFYPMITGRADGTGLGLSIAQSLINQHNGLIEFESEPGHTVFSIIIPISTQPSH